MQDGVTVHYICRKLARQDDTAYQHVTCDKHYFHRWLNKATAIWIVINFDVDGYVPGVLPLHKIEGASDDTVGLNGIETNLTVGSTCLAAWKKKTYTATSLFVSGSCHLI